MESKGWIKTKMGNLFRKRTERGVSGLPIMSVTTNNGMVLRSSLDRRTETNLSAEQHLLARKGDIVYNMMRMWQGVSVLAEADCLVSPAYIVCAPNGSIDSKFASYLLKYAPVIKKLEQYSHGITGDRLRLYFDDFAEIPIAVPSLLEQRKISEILSCWDRGAEQVRKLLISTRIEFKNLISKLIIGHAHAKAVPSTLGKISTINPLREKLSSNEVVTFLPMQNVSDEGDILSEIDKNAAELSTGYTPFKRGDVLVAKITPCFENGKGCLTSKLRNKYGFGSTEFHVLRPQLGVDPRFVYYITISDKFRQQGTRFMTGSAGQKRLPQEFISEFIVHLPSLNYQRSISDLLDSMVTYKISLQKLQDRLLAQKQALMQHLLTGRIRVRPNGVA